MKSAACFWGCLLAACAPARQPPPGQDTAVHTAKPPSRAGAAVPAPVAPAPALPAPQPSAAKASLLSVIEQTGYHESQPIDGLGHSLVTGPDANLVIDLPNGARAHIEPRSRAFVLAFEASALLVVSGSAWVEVPAQATPSTRMGLRLIAANASLFLPGMAELWITQRNWLGSAAGLSSQTYLALVRGFAELWRFDPHGPWQMVPLTAGQAVLSGADAKSQSTPVSTLADARRAGAEFVGRRRMPIAIDAADTRLERALTGMADEQARGATLLARISSDAQQRVRVAAPLDKPQRAPLRTERAPGATRASSATPDLRAGAPDDIRAQQRALVAHSQRKHDLRELLLRAAEQSLFIALARCAAVDSDVATCLPVVEWRTRYVGRIAAAL
jgi:hypothetical protein